MRIFDFDRAIVRRPAPCVVHGLRAGEGEPPTYAGIAEEHVAYVAALREAGLEVTELPPLDAQPDALFVEDPALVFPEAAVLLKSRAPSRRGEADSLAPVLRELFPDLVELADGHVDGGDILVTPGLVFIGLSSRTDERGAEALATLLAGLGRESRIVRPPAATLHLKSGSSLVDEETVLVTRALAESGIFAGFRLIVVPEGEEGAANALRINARLLAGAEHPRTLERLAREPVELVPLATAEIARIDAGLSCMSLRWRAA